MSDVELSIGLKTEPLKAQVRQMETELVESVSAAGEHAGAEGGDKLVKEMFGKQRKGELYRGLVEVGNSFDGLAGMAVQAAKTATYAFMTGSPLAGAIIGIGWLTEKIGKAFGASGEEAKKAAEEEKKAAEEATKALEDERKETERLVEQLRLRNLAASGGTSVGEETYKSASEEYVRVMKETDAEIEKQKARIDFLRATEKSNTAEGAIERYRAHEAEIAEAERAVEAQEKIRAAAADRLAAAEARAQDEERGLQDRADEANTARARQAADKAEQEALASAKRRAALREQMVHDFHAAADRDRKEQRDAELQALKDEEDGWRDEFSGLQVHLETAEREQKQHDERLKQMREEDLADQREVVRISTQIFEDDARADLATLKAREQAHKQVSNEIATEVADMGRSVSQSLMNAVGNWAMYSAAVDAAKDASQTSTENLLADVEAEVQKILSGIAEQAGTKALYETGMGIAATARAVESYGADAGADSGATAHFAAAGVFAAIAGGAAVGARAIGETRGLTTSEAGQYNKPAGASGGGPSYGSNLGGAGAANENGPGFTVVINTGGQLYSTAAETEAALAEGVRRARRR